MYYDDLRNKTVTVKVALGPPGWYTVAGGKITSNGRDIIFDMVSQAKINLFVYAYNNKLL